VLSEKKSKNKKDSKRRVIYTHKNTRTHRERESALLNETERKELEFKKEATFGNTDLLDTLEPFSALYIGWWCCCSRVVVKKEKGKRRK